jgi:hypothetical protein
LARDYSGPVSLNDELKAIADLDWPLRKKVEAFLSGTITAAKFAEEMVIPPLRGQLNLRIREHAVVGTYFRMYAWMKTLAVLNEPMHYQAVASAARTLFELLLDLKILTEDTTGDSISRFLAFPELEKFRVASKVTRFREANPEFAIVDPAPMRAFLEEEGRAERVNLQRRTYYGVRKNGEPNHPRHWTGKDVSQRAREAGKQFESWYHELYSGLSWHMHSGSVGYEGLSEDGMHALFGLAHRHAQVFFLQGTVMCAKPLHLAKAIDGFFDLIARLETLPGEIIVKEQLEFIRRQAQEAAEAKGPLWIPG